MVEKTEQTNKTDEKMSSASIKLFDNNSPHSGVNISKSTLNYFERTIQPIFDEIKTTEDLILWIYIVILIGAGLLLNLMVMRSLLRIKCNGKCQRMSSTEANDERQRNEKKKKSNFKLYHGQNCKNLMNPLQIQKKTA